MIGGVTGERYNKEPLRQRWRRGDLAQNPLAATVALAGILAVGLLIAGVVVGARAVRARARARQQEAGAELIRQVAERGLSSYLPKKPVQRYYLLKKDDDIRGYAASHLEQIGGGNGSVSFQGGNLEYYADKETLSKSYFRIADDMKKYSQSEVTGHASGRDLIRKTQVMIDGEFSGAVERRGRRPDLPEASFDSVNVIGEGMIDFFTSLAVSEHAGEEFAFEAPFLSADGGRGASVWRVELLVRPGDAPPNEVRQHYPSGHGAEVVLYLGKELIQHTYYDDEHQLIWQQDSYSAAGTRIAVTREELMSAFPQAGDELDRWRRQFEDKDDAAWL